MVNANIAKEIVIEEKGCQCIRYIELQRIQVRADCSKPALSCSISLALTIFPNGLRKCQRRILFMYRDDPVQSQDVKLLSHVLTYLLEVLTFTLSHFKNKEIIWLYKPKFPSQNTHCLNQIPLEKLCTFLFKTLRAYLKVQLYSQKNIQMPKDQILQIFTIRIAALVVRLPDRVISTRCLEQFISPKVSQ